MTFYIIGFCYIAVFLILETPDNWARTKARMNDEKYLAQHKWWKAQELFGFTSPYFITIFFAIALWPWVKLF